MAIIRQPVLRWMAPTSWSIGWIWFKKELLDGSPWGFPNIGPPFFIIISMGILPWKFTIQRLGFTPKFTHQPVESEWLIHPIKPRACLKMAKTLDGLNAWWWCRNEQWKGHEWREWITIFQSHPDTFCFVHQYPLIQYPHIWPLSFLMSPLSHYIGICVHVSV